MHATELQEVPPGQTEIGDDEEAERREEEREARLKAEQDALDAEDGKTEAPADPPPAEEITLRGTEQLSFFQTGGKRPTSSTLTLRAKTIDVEKGTGFKKGDRVRCEVIFVVDKQTDADARDKATGMVVDATLKSSAFMEDVKILEVG